jgi:hypothetical protein
MHNGEAAAVNMNNIVPDGVYRILEKVNQSTWKYGRLKHFKADD